MTKQFRISHDGPVATLTLSTPEKRNAMEAPFWEDLPEAVRELDQSGETRVLVIASEGPHFSAGIDLSVLASSTPKNLGAAGGIDFYHTVKRMQDTFSCLETARIPVIAAIQGGCFGAGVDLVTACDLRVCAEDSFFTIYEIVVGMTADVGTFPRIVNLLPEAIVRELSYTGRKLSAEEALKYGFVNRVAADAQASLASAYELAHEIAAKAPMAVAGCKDIITYSRDHTTDEALDRIALWNAFMLHESEVMAAMAAKQTGEPGNFTPLPPLRSVDGRKL
ncbi:MAG: enoyl-CoA hydratase-related protein [Pseudomonadota bacterium]